MEYKQTNLDIYLTIDDILNDDWLAVLTNQGLQSAIDYLAD